MARTGVDQRDGSEPGTALLLWTGAVVGVLLRGATWVLSAFTVGPVLGVADLAADGFAHHRELLFAQAVLTIAAVLAAVVTGTGLQTDPARWRRPVRLLCLVFIVDNLAYLTPLVVVVTTGVGLTTPAWGLFGVAVLGNLGLAGLCVQILVRARRLRAPAAEPPVAVAAGPAG